MKKKKIPIFNGEYAWRENRAPPEVLDKVEQILRKEELYEDNLYYRGFDPARIKNVLKYGTDRNSNSRMIYAVPELKSAIGYGLHHAIKRMYKSRTDVIGKIINKIFKRKQMDLAISLYKKEELEQWDGYLYRFNLKKDVFPLVIFKFYMK